MMEDMKLTVLHRLSGGTPHGFRLAVDILVQRAHVVNRRLAAVSLLLVHPHQGQTRGNAKDADLAVGEKATSSSIHGDSVESTSLSVHPSELYQECRDTLIPEEGCEGSEQGHQHGDSREMWHAETSVRLCQYLDITSVAEAATAPLVLTLVAPDHYLQQLWLRKLTPRQTCCHPEYELVIRGTSWVAFLPLQKESRLVPSFPHRIELVPGEGIRLVTPEPAQHSPSVPWLQQHVLPKLAKWTEELTEQSSGPVSSASLRLVEPDSYLSLYQRLKTKYAAEFVKIWPENTDPLKFVHEDVAIAAYLLLLWQQDRCRLQRSQLQSFVDLGCGNGLLVHILNSEGHPGYGIDIRRRAIWDLYPPTTRLQVGSIHPSAELTFAGCDWLIGNHSDELTPWVPLMAAAGGDDTCFFLLPCCPWDFYSKYQRSDTRLSQYEEYLGYVCRLAERCGFEPETDRLRIPSTRRRCVVGRRRLRVVSTAERSAICAGDGGATFTPRAAVPVVRNCSQLRSAVVAAAVRQVALFVSESGPQPLAAVAQLLGGDTLRQLRRQCGGLQTLLRNHAQLFSVRRGQVALQTAEWLRAAAARPELSQRLKTSRCLLHQHLTCPLAADQCRYAHGEADLRTVPLDPGSAPADPESVPADPESVTSDLGTPPTNPGSAPSAPGTVPTDVRTVLVDPVKVC